MNYLILSPCSLGLFLVPHLGQEKEVEKVYFWHKDVSNKEVGKDLNQLSDWKKLEIVPDYHSVLNMLGPKNVVIIIDDVGLGDTGASLRKQGYRVIGGTPLTDKIEEDRQFATDLMSRVMNVPKSSSFKSWDQAMAFVKNHEKTERLVFKPNDADAPKEYTYLSKDIPDMVEAMKNFKEHWEWKEDFQIQKFVKGVEVDFNAYFNGKDFLVNSMFIYFENKPFMNDNIGPATGGAVAVQFARKPGGAKQFWEILQKLKPALKKASYKGQLSINCIVSEDDHKPYFLEFCGRFGYPSLPLDITLAEDGGSSIHKLFMALAFEKNDPSIFPTDKIGITAAVFVPPAPNGKDMTKTKGWPISWDEKWYKYFYPYYTMYDPKKEKMVLAGVSSQVLQVTCADSTLDGAKAMMYDTYFPTLKLQDTMYRTDAGVDAKKRIQKLKEWKIIE